MRKLTAEVSEDLYRRVKVGLAREGRGMSELLRELLAARFPEERS